MAYSSREELLALPGQVSWSSLYDDKCFFFSFLFYYFSKVTTIQKVYTSQGGFNSKSSLEQAQGPVSNSDAAVKTQTSCLLGLTSTPKQLWYQHQLTALVLSFLFIFIPRRPLTNKVSNTFKRKFITLQPVFLTALYWEIFQTFQLSTLPEIKVPSFYFYVVISNIFFFPISFNLGPTHVLYHAKSFLLHQT